MTNEELNTALYEKLFAEQQDFKGWLVKQTPEEILKHAYEYVVREDIVIEMEYHDLTDEEAKALLADEKPLQAIFSVYENTEGGHAGRRSIPLRRRYVKEKLRSNYERGDPWNEEESLQTGGERSGRGGEVDHRCCACRRRGANSGECCLPLYL